MSKLMKRISAGLDREIAAIERIAKLGVNASDLEIAEAMAEYYVSVLPYARAKARGRVSLSIHHDVSARSLDPPCPVEYDWHDKNTVGIITTDEARAKDWAIRAMLLGYAVFYKFRPRKGGGGGSQGSIQDWRNRHFDVGFGPASICTRR